MKSIINDFKYICMIMLFSVGYSYIFSRQYNLADTINILLIFTFLIYICSLVITCRVNQKYINGIYQHMAVILAGISIFIFAYIYLIRVSDRSIYSINKLTQLNLFYSLYEIVSIIIALRYRDKTIDIKKSLMVVIFISMVFSYISVNGEFNFWIKNGKSSSSNLICNILRLFEILLKVYAIALLRKLKCKLPKNFYTYVTLFLTCRIVMQNTGFLTLEYINSTVITINCMLLATCIYCIFKTMIVDGLENLCKNDLKEHDITIYENERKQSENIDSELEEELKDQLLNNISHEFRTPVNVIYSAVQTQELLNKSENKSDCKNYNNIIKKNCNRLIRLINNFIDANKLDKGNIDVKLECVNIINVTKRIADSVKPYAECKKLNISFYSADEKLYALIDIRLFNRMILNLFSNAIKFSEDSGNIKIHVCSSSKYIEIVVEDDGIGIDKSDLKLIFKKFERLDKSFSRISEGSGLGLHIVQAIINLFNGMIEIESEKEKGTRVKLMIPMYNSVVDETIKNEDIETLINYNHEVEIEMSDIYL